MKAQYYAALAYLYFRKQDLNQALSMCEQGLKIAGSVQYDAPHDELIWLKGLIEIERQNMPAARQALGQLRAILHSGSINAMNYKPAYKYYLHLLAKISAEDGKIHEATIAINDLKWIKVETGILEHSLRSGFLSRRHRADLRKNRADCPRRSRPIAMRSPIIRITGLPAFISRSC